jgi:lipooligosaccharide transport system permease protein
LTPLYHGVTLCRGLVLGRLGLAEGLVHVAYLGALVVIGLAWGRRTYTRRLWQ